MADNTNIFEKMAASLGNGAKSLFGPLMNAFGKRGKDSGEQSRLNKYLEGFGMSATGQENAEAAKNAESNGVSAYLQQLMKEYADAPSLNVREAAGRDFLSTEILKEPQPGPSAGPSQDWSAQEAFTAYLAGEYDNFSASAAMEKNVSGTRAVSALASQAGSVKYASLLEGLMASGANAAGSYLTGQGRILGDSMASSANGMGNYLPGLDPLGKYFEGYSAPAGGEGGGYFTTPPIIPPVPAGGVNDQPVNAQLEIKSAEPSFRPDQADIEAAMERRERHNIHSMMSASNNSGGY